jgi:hypothetical protein
MRGVEVAVPLRSQKLRLEFAILILVACRLREFLRLMLGGHLDRALRIRDGLESFGERPRRLLLLLRLTRR